jgi:CubicO group peptidase (beta-lactamase class C family)
VAATPDGKTAVSGGNDGTIRVWDVSSGRQLRLLGPPGEAVRAVAVSPDGHQVLSAGGGRVVDDQWQDGTDFTLRLWDLDSGQEVQRFRGHTLWVRSVAFSPDGTRIVSASNDRSVRLWDRKTGAELKRLEGHTGSVASVAVSPDSNWAVSGGWDRTIRLWNLKDPQAHKPIRTFSGHAHIVTSVVFSPDNRLILSASADRTVRLWDPDSGQEIHCFSHPTGVLSAAFSPDGRRLLSASGALPMVGDWYGAGRDLVLRLWDVESGQQLRQFRGHSGLVQGLAFLPDGYHALSASGDWTVRLWQLEGTEPPAPEVPLPQGAVVVDVDERGWEVWWRRLDRLNLFPVFLQIQDAVGSRRVLAIAARVPGGGWRTRGDWTGDQFVREVAPSLSQQGYHLLSLIGYPGRDPFGKDAILYSSVWLKDGKPPVPYAICPDTAVYQAKLKEMHQKQYRPAQVNGHTAGSSCGFTILFEPDDGTPYRVRHDLSAQEYQKFLDDGRADGYRPVSASGYTDGGQLRFTALLLRNDLKLEWDALKDVTAEQLKAENERRMAQGFRPVVVGGYRREGASRYLAVWVKGEPAEPPPLPQTGQEVPALAKFDEVMQEFMRDRNISAGTLAVVRNGRLMLARGYGHSDPQKRRRVQPDDPFRLASITKPITVAAIQKLIRAGKLRPDTRVFPLLAVEPPPGKTADPRLKDVTIQHLREHQGGWDRDAAFDPMFSSGAEIAAELGKPSPLTPADMVRYMAGQPLNFAPGSKTVYSNFGYCVLGRVIEKVTGHSYLEYVQQEILAPAGIKSVTQGRTLTRDRDPREPCYRDVERGRNLFPGGPGEVAAPDGTFCLEMMDATFGLIGSAVDVARFVKAYRLLDENPEPDNSPYRWKFGDMAGTFTLAVQRSDGVILVALFNQSKDPSGLDYNVIRGLLEKVVDRIEQWPAGEDL